MSVDKHKRIEVTMRLEGGRRPCDDTEANVANEKRVLPPALRGREKQTHPWVSTAAARP